MPNEDARAIAWDIVQTKLCSSSVCKFQDGCGCSDAIIDTIEALVAERDKLKERITTARVVLLPSPVKNLDGSTTTDDAAHNLAGALHDLKEDGVDQVCINTIERVLGQIVLAGNALEEDDD